MCELHVINNLWIYLSNSGGHFFAPGFAGADTAYQPRKLTIQFEKFEFSLGGAAWTNFSWPTI
jgi:hypothetical protein